MATPAQVIEQAGVAKQAEAQQRHRELEDEQRKVTLKTLQEDADNPADKVAAIQAVYHKDPGVLKQHVENLTRRITGKQAQPVVSPQDAQQKRLAPLVARGKTPDQQALLQQQASGDIANKQSLGLSQQEAQQKQQQTFSLIDKYLTDPEQNKAAKEDYVRRQAGISNAVKNISGAAGQPVETSPGSGQYARPVQGSDGTIVYQPMPAGWKPPAPAQSKAALQQYIRAKFGDNPTAEQMAQATREHQALMSGLTVGSHQTIAYDADGVPHVITLTTSSRKDFGATPKGEPAPRKAAGGASQPKGGQLDFRKATPQSTAAKKAVDTAENSYLDVQKASQDPTPVGDQGVILAWLRGRVNRVTNTEIQAVNNLGGAKMKLEGAIVRIESGKMTDQQRQWFLRSAKDNYATAQTVASKYDSPNSSPAPKKQGEQSGGGKSLADRLNEALQ